MNRIWKYIVAAALSAGLALGSAPKAKANVPTIDISNLVQNIMDFMESQMREGSFFDLAGGGVTKLEELQERYRSFQEKMIQFQTIADNFRMASSAWSSVKELIELGNMIADDTREFSEVMQVLSTNCRFLTLISTRNFGYQFASVTTILFDYVKSSMKTFRSLSQSDPLQLITTLNGIVDQAYDIYFMIRNDFRRRLAETYRMEMQAQSMQLDAYVRSLIIV